MCNQSSRLEIRGFPTRMIYLEHDIYSRDTPFWSGTIVLLTIVSVALWPVVLLHSGRHGDRSPICTVQAYQWAETGTLVAALQNAFLYRVISKTGWRGVSILWHGEVASLICSTSDGLSRSVPEMSGRVIPVGWNWYSRNYPAKRLALQGHF